MIDPAKLIGSIRRFGPFGPAYEVEEIKMSLPEGDAVLLIKLIETGEELEHRASDALVDPEAD